MLVAVLSGCYKLDELSILYDIDVADYRDKNRFIKWLRESLDFNTFDLRLFILSFSFLFVFLGLWGRILLFIFGHIVHSFADGSEYFIDRLEWNKNVGNFGGIFFPDLFIFLSAFGVVSICSVGEEDK